MRNIFVADGDTITIWGKLDPSVADPAHEWPAISRTYRVVVNGFPPVVELVQIGEPVYASQEVYKRLTEFSLPVYLTGNTTSGS